MRTAILSGLIFSFLMCFIAGGYADLTSWVNSNGGRHYSNTAAPDNSTTLKNTEEFKHGEKGFGPRRKSDRKDGFSVLRMYEKDRGKRLEKKKKAEEVAEIHKHNEEVRRSERAARRADKKRQAQYCQEAERKFDRGRGTTVTKKGRGLV